MTRNKEHNQKQEKYLVAGGAGFFGEILVKKLLSQNKLVRSFDLNNTNIKHPNLEVITGDVTNPRAVDQATDGVDLVLHNIAQVPIAKDKELFWSVNEGGTKNLLKSSLKHGVRHFIYTSSSAVYGAPEKNPVNEKTPPSPAEDYGRAKLAGELLCKEYIAKGLVCSIVRPRTILGMGRLGIFQILFEWIYKGLNIPVIDKGKNIYQFIHAKDLATACIAAAEKAEPNDYNIGAETYGTMYEVLESLILHSNSKSRIRSVSSRLIEAPMNLTSKLGVSPLGAYHALMYGKDMYFDIGVAKKELQFKPIYSNNEMFIESYEWYCKNRGLILSGKLSGSKHQTAIKQKILRVVPYLI